MNERAAAFFDLDRTLMAGASAYHFGRALYKAGQVTRSQLPTTRSSSCGFACAGPPTPR